MNYRNNRGYHDEGRNGFERPRRSDFSNSRQRGGNVQAGYKPNTGKAKPNFQRRKETDPAFTGVLNVVTASGQQETFFISIWENHDGSLGLGFKAANEQGQQGYGQRSNQGGYNGGQQSYNGGYEQNGYNRPQQSAMSRARPIPQPVYHEGPPPHDSYPEGPEMEPGSYEGPPYE